MYPVWRRELDERKDDQDKFQMALYYADKYNSKNDMPNLSGISTAFPLKPKTNQSTPRTTKRKAMRKAMRPSERTRRPLENYFSLS